MKKLTNFGLVLLLVGSALVSPNAGHTRSAAILPASSPGKLVQRDNSISSFWEKFKSAVAKEDKVAVAALSQFPISMPYGMATIRTLLEGLKRGASSIVSNR